MKTKFNQAFHADFCATVDSLDFFNPRCELINVNVNAADSNEWNWQAQRFTFSFSWWNILWHQRMYLHIAAESLTSWSKKKSNTIPLFDHIFSFANTA